jgi:hypothetical protein
MITKIKLEVSDGSNITDVIKQAKSMALDYQSTVSFEFNSVEMEITPAGANKYWVDEIVNMYSKELIRPRKVTI